MFLSRISMSAKQEEGRIEHHFIDIKKIFPMHPDSGFQHFVVFLPSNSGEDQVRPGETHKHPGTLWDASCTVFGPEEKNSTATGERQDTAVQIPVQQTNSSPPS